MALTSTSIAASWRVKAPTNGTSYPVCIDSGEARGSQVTLLDGGTAIEELIEGLSIGVGLAVDPLLGVMIGAAIVLDNLVEGISIAEIIKVERPERASRQIFAWTGLIGLALFSAATVGWLVSRDIADGVMGTLLAIEPVACFIWLSRTCYPDLQRRNTSSLLRRQRDGIFLMFALSGR